MPPPSDPSARAWLLPSDWALGMLWAPRPRQRSFLGGQGQVTWGSEQPPQRGCSKMGQVRGEDVGEDQLEIGALWHLRKTKGCKDTRVTSSAGWARTPFLSGL